MKNTHDRKTTIGLMRSCVFMLFGDPKDDIFGIGHPKGHHSEKRHLQITGRCFREDGLDGSVFMRQARKY